MAGTREKNGDAKATKAGTVRYGESSSGTRVSGGPRQHYKDICHAALKLANTKKDGRNEQRTVYNGGRSARAMTTFFDMFHVF